MTYLVWRLPPLGPGSYRVVARLVGPAPDARPLDSDAAAAAVDFVVDPAAAPPMPPAALLRWHCERFGVAGEACDA